MGFCFPERCRVCSVDDNSGTLPDTADDFEIPVTKRKTTDRKYFKILIIFLTFLAICIGVAFVRSDTRRILYGYDDYGNICGVNNPPIEGVNKSGVDFSKNKYFKISHICRLDNSVKEEIIKCWTDKTCVSKCTNGYEKSIKPMCRSPKNDKWKIEPSYSPFELFEKIGLDIAICWKEITVLLFVSICFSVLPMVSLRYMAKTVIWTVLIFTTLAGITGSIYSWVTWWQKKQALKDYIGSDTQWRESEITKWLIGAVCVSIFTVIYLCIVITLRNKMKMVAVLFEEASKCIAAMPAILLLPVLTFILEALVCCFVGLGLIVFQTSGKPDVDELGNVTFPVSGFFKFMRWMLLFGFLWISQFLLACQNLVIAGSIATWYFKRNKGNLNNPVWNSFLMIIFYHLGSAAFASLVLAIVKAVRALFRMLERSASKQGVLYFVWLAVQCLLSCLESFLQILSKNAYVMIVIYGQPFCASARRAYDCIVANASRIAAVDGVGTFILLMIELCVSFGVTFIAVAVFKNIEGLQSIWIPASLIFLFAYLCVHCFTSVYEMAIETLLICFCEDYQMNDGLARPYFMNRSLMIFLQDSRRNSTEMPARNVSYIQ